MKTRITCTFLCAFFAVLFSQNLIAQPEKGKLLLTGINPTLTKGDIDLEVLSILLQQKQLEIANRYFKNSIIKHFNETKSKSRIDNFTTYVYAYSLMETLTSGKNKTAMTKDILNRSAEFAFIQGFTLYLNNELMKSDDLKDLSFDLRLKPKDCDKYDQNKDDSKMGECYKVEVAKYNQLLDFCCSLVYNKDLKGPFKFQNSLFETTFNRWYVKDNVYENLSDKTEIDKVKPLAQECLKNLEIVSGFTNHLKSLSKKINNNTAKDLIESTLKKFDDLKGEEISTDLEKIKNDYSDNLSTDQIALLGNAIGFFKEDYDHLKNVFLFFKDIEKDNFNDFSLTENQFKSLRYVIKDFSEKARDKTNNSTLSRLLDFLFENTLIEYLSADRLAVSSEDSKVENGYLYMDIESLILSIHQFYSQASKRQTAKVVSPIFTMGVNHSTFLYSNSLRKDNQSPSNSIGQLSFASEKIGFKINIHNMEYTHSFKPGETWSYGFIRNRSWNRPPTEYLLKNFHLVAYGSGILYNLVDVTSEENFDYTVVGTGIGVTFFNNLTLGVNYSTPIVSGGLKSQNSFVGFNLDIPIVEYINALAKRN